MRFEGAAPSDAPPDAPDDERPARKPAAALRSILRVETLIYAFGSWTIGYWVTLLVGGGSIVAASVGAVVLGSIVVFGPAPGGPAATARDVGDLGALILVLGIVLAWPIVLDAGRTFLGAVAFGLVAVRLLSLLGRGRSWSPSGAAAVLVAVAAAVAARHEWWSFVVVGCGVAASLVAMPDWPERLDRRFLRVPGSCPRGRRGWAAPLEAVVLLALGGLVAVWHAGAEFWNPDNTYYLNKALHFGDHPSSFPTQDLLYGVDGIQHVPFGNLLSSYEPLLGALARASGLSVTDLVFALVAPGVLALLPFAVRYAARGLGIQRPALAGALAPASILLMTGTDSVALFAQMSLGKDLGRLVFIPLLFGAIGHLLRSPDRRSALTAVLASVCVVGMSPSLGVAAVTLVAPFTASGVLTVWQRRADLERARAITLFTAPLAAVAVFVVFAAAFQARSGQVLVGFRAFDAPEAAWDLATGMPLRTSTLLGLVILSGSAVAFPILLQPAMLRRGGGMFLLLLLGVVFSPWTFDLVVGDLLDLNHFAWRILWVLPFAMLIGMVAASLDTARPLGLLTIAAVVVSFGLSGPPPVDLFRAGVVDVRDPPARWPWEDGVPGYLRGPATSLIEATPTGGRFLATASVEEVATATQIDRYPVYARLSYIRSVVANPSTPSGAMAEDRLLLGLGINGESTPEPLTVEEWTRALDRVDVSSVCVGVVTTPELRRAVEAGYRTVATSPECTVWSRAAASP